MRTGMRTGARRAVVTAVAGALAVPLSVVGLAGTQAGADESGGSEVVGTQPELLTWFDAPAVMPNRLDAWQEQSLPLGNGPMGAAVFGEVENDEIIINLDSYWTGGPGQNPEYDGGFNDRTPAENAAALEHAQEVLQESWDATTRVATVDENGVITPATEPSEEDNQRVIDAVNELVGEKSNFGSFRSLGTVMMNTGEVISIIGFSANYVNPNSGSETTGMFFDGDVDTKVYADKFGGIGPDHPYIVEWSYTKGFPTDTYRLATGNDVPGRDFMDWNLYAGNNGSDWELVDTVTGYTDDERKSYTDFELDVPGTYDRYRIEVTATREGRDPQMSEIEVPIPEATEEPAEATDYRRELDLDHAIASVEYTKEGVDYAREYFVSAPDQVLAIRLTASEPGAVSQVFSLKPTDPRDLSVEGDTVTATGWVSGHGAQAEDDENKFNDALHYAQQLKVIPEGDAAEIVPTDSSVFVKNADSVVVLVAADTNYQADIFADEPYPGEDPLNNYFDGRDPLIDVESSIAAASAKSYQELRDAHVADYKSLFDRVRLNLGNVPAALDKTTPELLDGYADGTNTPEENLYLEELYYQFGRYLLISSSREGSLPANLQGVWSYGTSAPWSGDYHANINLQMNYWLAEQTNLSELTEPLITYVQSLVPRGTVGAEKVFGEGTRGWTTWHENNTWGNTAPATSSAFFSPEDGAWLAQHVWEHYRFTLDEEYLADNYALLRDAALFWVDTLVWDTSSNKLVVSPSYSPEHGPYSQGATEPQSVVRGLFDDVIEAYEVLKDSLPAEEADAIAEITESRAGMLGLQIAPQGVYYDRGNPNWPTPGGQLQEWQFPIARDFTGDGGHKHVNHLYALHPGDEIVAGRSERDDELVEAARVTLTTRGDGGTGWSMAWKMNFWSRVRDGERAHHMFSQLLKNGTYDNLWDAHPPFQIDGNFGATSGATEMLLQSQGDSIDLLPALAPEWTEGSVQGLRARGNVGVDIAWDESRLTEAVLTPEVSQTLKVTVDDVADLSVVDSEGNEVATEAIPPYDGEADGSIIRFEAAAGESYRISAEEGTDPTEDPSEDPSEEPTVDPSEEPTGDPSEEPTGDPSEEPTAEPTKAPSEPAGKPAPVAPYEVPGFHNINGRWWYTECEPYSQTVRCRTEIWATTVVLEGGRFIQSNEWVFNNLTYLPKMKRAQWAANPLGHAGSWTADDGSRWRTECDTPTTGQDACRTYRWSSFAAGEQGADGKWSYSVKQDWVFNNMVRFAR